MANILVVEDHPSTAESIADALMIEGHDSEIVATGLDANSALNNGQFEVAIIDWELPGKAGPDIIRDYREQGGQIPILMLTGKDQIDDKIDGLESGADDYLPKPFSIHELQARVRALLRRPEKLLPKTLSAQDLVVNEKALTVTRRGEEIALLNMEMALLDFFLRHKGQAFTPEELLNQVWNSESDSTESAVRKTIGRLRKKIDIDGEESLIKSVRGMGYSIE